MYRSIIVTLCGSSKGFLRAFKAMLSDEKSEHCTDKSYTTQLNEVSQAAKCYVPEARIQSKAVNLLATVHYN